MDKIVIITGVSRESGLGFETKRQMKDLGYKVILTARYLGKVSKLALNGLTVKLATQLKKSKFKINSVDLGFTVTYLGTEEYGESLVEEGVKGIVWAATLHDDGPTLGFFKYGELIN